MNRYYYITIEHEALIAQMIAIWDSQSPNAYVVCTPAHYLIERVSEQGQDVNSVVYDMRKQFIKKVMYIRTQQSEWNKYTLTAFTIEGDLPTQYDTLARSLNGTRVFNTNVEYLEFLQSLPT